MCDHNLSEITNWYLRDVPDFVSEGLPAPFFLKGLHSGRWIYRCWSQPKLSMQRPPF